VSITPQQLAEIRRELGSPVSIPVGAEALGEWADLAGRRRAIALMLLNALDEAEGRVITAGATR
jgi:hypothetical protein